MTFLWGTATAAHQNEGDNVASDWWDYEQKGRLPFKSGRACDFWNRWREDFDLIESMGHNAFRMSVEWARLEPEAGKWDEAALGRYVEMVADLRRRGIEPVVTLHHFVLPLWFARAGGFEKQENIDLFERYCEKVVPALAQHVRWWVTINEPVVYAYESYSRGNWPPLKKDFNLTLLVLGNVMEAHARAYAVIHRHRADAMVSIAKHMRVMQPYRTWHPGDRLAAALQDYFGNEAVLRSLVTGKFLRRRIPGLAGSFDYVGLNYYSRNRLVVTENGISTDDAADPTRRIRYLHTHLDAVERAMKAGVDVRGYLYWTLMDDFEWAEGFDKTFGLVAMNPDDRVRRPQPSAAEFTKLKERFVR